MAVWLALLLLTVLWLLPGTCALVYHIQRRRGRFRGAASPAERALAEERSSALLRDLLNEQEYQQLIRHGYLDVASPSHAERVYRIPRNAGRVRVYVEGRALVELCIQPVVPLPANDVIVLHKLMIEGNEQGYLARANEIPLALPSPFYDQQRWTFLTS